MSPSDAVCVVGLIVVALTATWGIYRSEAKLPPRPKHKRAEDYRLAETNYMRFRGFERERIGGGEWRR